MKRINENLYEVGGLLVSRRVFEEVSKNWPKRDPLDTDRYYGACIANHVLLTSRELGECDPEIAPSSQGIR